MRQNTEFELIGHDSPTGKYPSAVVPIGRFLDAGELVAVYIDSIESEPILEPVAKNANFIHHDATLKELLKNFDYRKDSLFALTPEDVKFYAVQDEKDFFKGLLVDENFASTNPFLRLSLAEATKDLLLVRKELDPCEKFLEENAPDLAPIWKLEKKIALLGLLNFKQADEENFLIERKQLQVLHQIVTGELLASVRELEGQQKIKPIVEKSKLSQLESEVAALEKQVEETQNRCEQIQQESLLLKESTKNISACLHRLLAMELSDFIVPLNESLELMKGKMQFLSSNGLMSLFRTDSIIEYKRLRFDLSNLFDQKSLVDGWLQITQEVLKITSINQWLVSAPTLKGVKCLQHEMQQIKEQIQLLESQITDLDESFYPSLLRLEPQSFGEPPLPDSRQLERELAYA